MRAGTMNTVSQNAVDSESMAVHFRELDEIGYTVLVDLLSPGRLRRLSTPSKRSTTAKGMSSPPTNLVPRGVSI